MRVIFAYIDYNEPRYYNPRSVFLLIVLAFLTYLVSPWSSMQRKEREGLMLVYPAIIFIYWFLFQVMQLSLDPHVHYYLGPTGLNAWMPMLLATTRHDPDMEVRKGAMDCISKIGRVNDDVIQAMNENLAGNNSSVDNAAFGVLAAFSNRSKEAFVSLIKAMRNCPDGDGWRDDAGQAEGRPGIEGHPRRHAHR